VCGGGDQVTVVADDELKLPVGIGAGIAEVAGHSAGAVWAPRTTTVHSLASGSWIGRLPPRDHQVPKPYAAEFRRRVLDFVRAGRTVTAVVTDLGIGDQTRLQLGADGNASAPG
jgi:hypothetical protein